MRILIIDDEKGIRDGCERILSRMGFETTTACNGNEGLEKITKEVSIVLLDLKMPGIDGMEVLKQIREKYDSILVIIMTGFATVETAIEAMKRGAYDFIPKPFEPDHVRLVIGKARDKIQLTQEAYKLEQERKKTLMDLSTEKSRIRSIIEFLPNGLIVTNTIGQVVLMNPAFYRLIGIPQELQTGNPIESYVNDTGFCKFVKDISKGDRYEKIGDQEDVFVYELSMPNAKYFLARGRHILADDNEQLGAVIVLVNITTIKMLEHLKSEFVAKVSHELRSPLSTIHEQLATVLNDIAKEMDTEKSQYLLSRAKEKTQGLISLIGDLLDLSRIEAGAVMQDKKPVDVVLLLKSIVDFLGTKAKSKKQTISFQLLCPTQIPELIADPMALESIFGNLVTNAINYTPDGGTIRVDADMENNYLKISIIDNGFGIDKKYHEQIFERFYRVKNDKTRYITGTGLGLPIVKGLVESLKGQISVQSEPDKGSCFTVSIPIELNNL